MNDKDAPDMEVISENDVTVVESNLLSDDEGQAYADPAPGQSVQIIPVKEYKPNIALTNIDMNKLATLEEDTKELPDVTTKEGMERCKWVIKTSREMRLSADIYRAEIKKPAFDWCDKVEGQWKLVKPRLKAIEERHKLHKAAEDNRKKLIKEEKQKAENARIAAIDEAINNLRMIPVEAVEKNYDATQIKQALDVLSIESVDEEIYQERLSEAQVVRDASMQRLRDLLETKLAQVQQAEKMAKQEAELVEQQRVAGLELQVGRLMNYVIKAGQCANSEQIKAIVNEVAKIDPKDFGDFKREADLKLTEVYNTIKKMYEEQIEMEVLQREKIERDRKDAEQAKLKEVEVVEPEQEFGASAPGAASLESVQKDNKNAQLDAAAIEYMPAGAKKTMADDAYDAFVDILGGNQTAASTIIEALEANSIPHVHCDWIQ